MFMSIKNRKQQLEKLSKQAEQDALVKQAAEEADQQAADSTDYSEKIFAKLLQSIKIEGLED
jgi:hypothetical protein